MIIFVTTMFLILLGLVVLYLYVSGVFTKTAPTLRGLRRGSLTS